MFNVAIIIHLSVLINVVASEVIHVTPTYTSDYEYVELNRQLIEAAKRGRLDVAKRLIGQGANVDATLKLHGWSSLLYSAQNGDLNFVEMLVDNGASVNYTKEDGVTALLTAAWNGHLNVVNFLYEHNADLNAKNNAELTALHLACLYGHEDVARWLIQKQIDINALDNNGRTALHLASLYGYLDVVNLLLEKGSRINVIDKQGETALDLAREGGHFQIVDAINDNNKNNNNRSNNNKNNNNDLVSFNVVDNVGSNINSNDEATEDDTLLIEAANRGSLDSIKTLVAQGANVNASNSNGWTALHSAAQNGDLEVLRYLLDQGANINSKSKDNVTPLLTAAWNGRVDVVSLLIDRGANKNAKNKNNATALHLAAIYDQLEVAKVLIENEVNINAVNSDGQTPLFLACFYGYLEIVEYLLEKGANTEVTDNSNQKPVDAAIKGGYSEIVEVINRFNEEHKQILRPAAKACERYSLLPVGYIISGSLANAEEFPWMAALVYFNTFNYSFSFDCGGTIISERYVLTAAHCMKRRPPAVIRVGKLSLTDEKDDRAVNYHVETITKHPNWLSLRRKNDIALIRVTQRIEFNDFIMPACLHTDMSDLSQDKKLIVTGWGSTSADQYQISNNLRKAELKSSPLQACNASYLNYNTRAKLIEFENGISDSQYCAHDPVNNSDSCQGDSGGPLQFFPTNNSLGHVVGVVSFGINCATELPGIYTRVAYYLDWIESIVWPNSQ